MGDFGREQRGSFLSHQGQHEVSTCKMMLAVFGSISTYSKTRKQKQVTVSGKQAVLTSTLHHPEVSGKLSSLVSQVGQAMSD